MEVVLENQLPKSVSNIIYVDEEVTAGTKKFKRGCNNKSFKCITHNLWNQLDQHIVDFWIQSKI